MNKQTTQSSQSGFGLIGIIFIALLLLAIPIGIYLVNNQQLTRSKAFQPPPVSAPDLSITLVSDKGLYRVGDNVKVAVYVKDQIEAANLYVVKLKYPTDHLNFQELDKSPSDNFVETWTQDIIDPEFGSVSLVAELKNLSGSGNSGYVTPLSQYGSHLADLNFTANSVGIRTITFSDSTEDPSGIYSVATNDNILVRMTPVNIEVTDQADATPAPSATPITSSPSPTSTATPSASPKTGIRLPEAIANPTNQRTSADLGGLKSRWGLTTADALKADLNNDGVINNFDRGKLLCDFGQSGIYVYSCATATPKPSSTP